jgi:RHS repeat-associated protein
MRHGFVLLLAAFSALLSDASVFAAEGRTPGQFAVNRNGSAQYSIPIWAPPGPRGIQPALSLIYNSQSGAGTLGVGWSLAGLGAISRCNETYAQDSTLAPIALVTSDGYCLNGNRLRLTGGTYGTAGSTYQTEIANFSNVTANGTAGNGPAYFTVQGKDGLTYQYGYTDANGYGANSQVLASGTTTAITWLLSKVTDRAGNSMAINYIAGTSTAVPGTIYWTPSSAGSSTYNYQMIFTYTTNNPQTSVYGYVAGAPVTNVNLLVDVTVTYSGTTVKKYILTYQPALTTGRNELKQIKECADSGANNCLLPTTMTYQDGILGISSAVKTAVSSAPQAVNAKYDFNGDGYPDLVYYNGSSWYVAFGSASGYGTPVNTGITAAIALFGDLQGTGKDEILANNGGTYYYYTWNGSSFTGATTHLLYDSAVMLADVDGDGLPDLIYLSVEPGTQGYVDVTTRLSTSTPSGVSFSSFTLGAYSSGPRSILTARLIPPDREAGSMRAYDFDGDGRKDLALVIESRTTPTQYYYYELLSTGQTFTGYLLGTGSQGYTTNPVFINWNDDACTDAIWNGILYISSCNGTTGGAFSVPGGTVLTVANYDGAGRGALLVPNGSTIGVYLSTGTGISSTITPTSIPYSSSCAYFTFDADGDGLDDLGCASQTSPNSVTYYLHNGAGTKPDLATAIVDGYGNSASPAYVSIVQTGYTEYSDATFPYQNYIGPLYVVRDVVFSDPSKMPSGTYNQQFWYYGAWMNLQGRGFQGFNIVNTYDSRTGLHDYQYFERSFPYTGMKYQDIVFNGTFYPSESVGTTALTTLDGTANNERYFPYISNWTSYQWEVGGTENSDAITTTSTNFTYDSYGNATNIVKTVDDSDPGSPYSGYTWTTNITNTTDISANQSADLAAWCLTMLDETQVVYSSTLSGSSSVTRTKTFTPDTPTACRIKTTVTEPTANSGLYKVTEALTFDSFGNVQTDTVTGNNMPSSPASRETQLNWGTTGQFLNSSTDPSNATTTWTYTSSQALTFGVPDSMTNANNLKTSWGYDDFGRKTSEARPDKTSTTWTWSACTSYCGWSNSVYQVQQTTYQTNGTTAIRTDTTSYDPIDRVTQTAGPTVTGATATVQRLYTPIGLLGQQSMPFLSGTPYQQTYGYDVLNRLTSVTRPISSTNSNPQSTTYAYAGRKLTTYDPYGHTKTTITDVNGWLRQTKDAVGYNVTRAYDSGGSLIGITDSVGNSLLKSVTYNYGIKPFLVAATDADRGAWSYTVDSLGEATSWTDAKGQSFAMSYDALSRPLSRTEPDLFTQWTWGSTPASYNVGQLIGECTGTGSACVASTGYSETRTFDSYGRLSTRAIAQGGNPGNDPGGVFLFTNGYDTATGLLKTLTYPITTPGTGSPLKVQYAYQNGVLQSVTDTSDTTSTCGSTCTLWTANAMNGFRQITQETLGNGVVMNRTYDAVTSWLSAATGGVGGGAALLNQSYLEDENGNIIQRQNNNLGLTESFAYDADNRLTCTALSSTCTTPTLAYDAAAPGPGNITSQTGVGTYTYPVAGQPRPHAVTSITGTFNGIVNPSFSYDANGNMTNRASSAQNIYWYSFNYPLSITGTDATGTEEVQFSYGPDRQRWKQIYTGPSGTETTYYIGGLMDLVFNGTTNYRHYIYAGSEPVAIYSRTSAGVNTMSYMLQDHQSSPSAITSNAGAPDVSESFSAFGTRRNPATWSGAPSTTDLNTIAGLSRQGYTFQTWLGQSMGLNHMNGRVQDAILGRFLSPDPHTPDPSNAQSYNRYSYVNNNPLTLVDSSGYYPQAMEHCMDGCWFGGIGTIGFWGIQGVQSDGNRVPAPPRPGGSVGYTTGNGSPADGGPPDNNNKGTRDASSQPAQSQYPDAIYSVPGPVEAAAAAGESGVAILVRSVVSAIVNFVSGLAGGSSDNTPASVPVGRSGNPMNVEPGTNSPGSVNGTDYSGHAFDQMQGRGIPPSAVENSIETGVSAPGNLPGTTTSYDAVNNLTVVTNSYTGRVITVRPGPP